MSKPKTISDIINEYDAGVENEKLASAKINDPSMDEIEKLAAEMDLIPTTKVAQETTPAATKVEPQTTSAPPEATKEASVSVSNLVQNLFPAGAGGAEQEKVAMEKEAAAVESAMGEHARNFAEAVIDSEIEKVAQALVEEHGDVTTPHPQELPTNEDKSGKPIDTKKVEVPAASTGDEGQVGEVKKAAYQKHLLLSQLED